MLYTKDFVFHFLFLFYLLTTLLLRKSNAICYRFRLSTPSVDANVGQTLRNMESVTDMYVPGAFFRIANSSRSVTGTILEG